MCACIGKYYSRLGGWDKANYFPRSLDEFVTLRVLSSLEAREFKVHKYILSAASSKWQAEVHSASTDLVITLKAFGIQHIHIQSMIYWLYSYEICIPMNPRSATSTTSWALGFLRALYNIGSEIRYDMPKFRNDIIDATLDLRKQEENAIISNHLYLPSFSYQDPFDRLLTKFAAYSLNLEQLVSVDPDEVEGLLLEFAKATIEMRDKSKEKDSAPSIDHIMENFCQEFHVHEAGVQACKEIKKFVVFVDEKKGFQWYINPAQVSSIYMLIITQRSFDPNLL